MPTDPIRIRITPRVQEPGPRDRREAFWAAVRAGEDSNASVESDEARLTREFGPKLRQALVRHLSEPLRTLDSELFPRSLLDFEHWIFRIEKRSSETDRYGYQFAEVFARLIEQRQQALRENPALRGVQDRVAAAAGVTFAARIAGYSSLNLELSTGSLKQLAKAFDGDFESFRVFLDAFVPAAFADVFNENQADRLEFAVAVPASLEQAFQTAVRDATQQHAEPALPGAVQGASTSRERAEWLWRLANGSLLIPVLLALFVMYQGMKMLSEIRGSQYEAVQPVLEHQLKLLEQDRQRFAREAAPAQPQVPPQPANPATK